MSIVVNKTRLPVTQWQTESGSVVSISDARKRYAKSLSVALEPIQDLHGYSNPWVGGAGKNLLKTAGLTEGAPSDTTFSNATKRTFTVGTFVPKLTNNNYYQGGVNIQFSVSENSIKVTSSARAYAISIPIVGLTIGEKYVLSCTKTNASNNIASFYKQDGTFISNTPSLTICTFTVPEETYYTLLHFDPSQNNVEATFTDIQLEKGSVPSSYAPYENLCPISGRSSVTAVRDGKNLTPYAGRGYSTRIWGTTWPDQLALIKTLKPSQYTISAKYKILTNPNNEATVEMGMLLRWRDSGGTWHQIIPYQLTTVSAEVGAIHNYSKTFTLSEDDLSAPNLEFYLYCGTGTTATTANCYDFQIEHGSTAIATYEPFQGISVTLSLGQTVYGCNVDLVSGVMTANKVTYSFTGTENYINKSSSRPASFYMYWKDFPNKGKNNRPFLCSHAIYNSNFATYAFGQCFADSSCSLWIQNDTSMTVNQYKQLLADYYNNGNPVQVCYELATPQTIQLSPNQIEMLMRNNTIWSDDGIVTLNYARIHQ